jgi:Bacterial aa3 type cytochrome c oxidase subunit IV
MAETDARSAGHPAMDYEEHEKTCRMFLLLIKYSIAGVAVVLCILAYLLG